MNYLNEGLLYPAYLMAESRRQYKEYKKRGGQKTFEEWMEARVAKHEYENTKKELKDLRKASREASKDKYLEENYYEEAFLEGYLDAINVINESSKNARAYKEKYGLKTERTSEKKPRYVKRDGKMYGSTEKTFTLSSGNKVNVKDYVNNGKGKIRVSRKQYEFDNGKYHGRETDTYHRKKAYTYNF